MNAQNESEEEMRAARVVWRETRVYNIILVETTEVKQVMKGTQRRR